MHSWTIGVYFGSRAGLPERRNYTPTVYLGAKNENKETGWHPKETLTEIMDPVPGLPREVLHKELPRAP